MKRGRRLRGMELAGGEIFERAVGRAATANITPDPRASPTTDEALFVQVLRTGFVKAASSAPSCLLGIPQLDRRRPQGHLCYLRTVKR